MQCNEVEQWFMDVSPNCANRTENIRSRLNRRQHIRAEKRKGKKKRIDSVY